MNVRVGVASIIIRKDMKILLGLRKGSHGSKTWAPPGGHLEFNETPAQCAIRETKEETNIDITNVTSGPWTNDIFTREKKHYITLFILSHHHSGEACVMEPEKCERWQWFDWQSLPDSLFKPFTHLIQLGHHIDTLQLYLNNAF